MGLKLWSVSRFGLLGLLYMCAASPAIALEAKQCLPLAEMNAALQADGQRTLIIGDRIAAVGNTAHPGIINTIRNFNAITSNEDGSIGYQLEGDKSRTEISTDVCVRAKLTDIQLFDARRATIPKAAYLGGDFNKTVDESATVGSRPMLLANTVFGSGTTKHNGLPIIIFGNIPEQAAAVATKSSKGRADLLFIMNRTEYTLEALRRLAQVPAPNRK